VISIICCSTAETFALLAPDDQPAPQQSHASGQALGLDRPSSSEARRPAR
jgi:hypothetical protein